MTQAAGSAYVAPLAQKCDAAWCQKIAVLAVRDAADVLIGNYCQVHGEQMLNLLHNQETVPQDGGTPQPPSVLQIDLQATGVTSLLGTWTNLTVDVIQTDNGQYATVNPARNTTPQAEAQLTFPALGSDVLPDSATIVELVARMTYQASRIDTVGAFCQLQLGNATLLVGTGPTEFTPESAAIDLGVDIYVEPDAANFPTLADLRAGNVSVHCFAGRSNNTSYTFLLGSASYSVRWQPLAARMQNILEAPVQFAPEPSTTETVVRLA